MPGVESLRQHSVSPAAQNDLGKQPERMRRQEETKVESERVCVYRPEGVLGD